MTKTVVSSGGAYDLEYEGTIALERVHYSETRSRRSYRAVIREARSMVTRITVREGAVTLPDELRERYGIEDGTVVLAEAGTDGILLRADDSDDFEIYTPERVAEFLLSNSMDAEDYAAAAAEVRRMGLDPNAIDHYRPEGVE